MIEPPVINPGDSLIENATRTSTAVITMGSRIARPPRDLGTKLVATWSQVECNYSPLAPAGTYASSLLTPNSSLSSKELREAFLREPSPGSRTPTSPSVFGGGGSGVGPTHRYAGVERLANRQRIYDPAAAGFIGHSISPQSGGPNSAPPAVTVSNAAGEDEGDVSGREIMSSEHTNTYCMT